VDFLTYFLDNAHELVAHDVSGLHGRNEAVVEVKIRAADSGPCDLDDCVVGIQELGSATVRVSTLLFPIQQIAFITSSDSSLKN
jgi:hypothetical protein